MSVQIEGVVAAGFEPIGEVFEAAFADAPGMGAALAILVDGEVVVQLHGGIADERDGRRWDADTASVIFSCTKGLMSLMVARLVDEGRLDYAAPVARYWPEFAAAGKERITVREAVAHRAGLLAPTDDLSVDDITDWAGMTARIAAQAPIFPPDSGYAYHSITHGWLTGELVRRITGVSPGTYFAREIAGQRLKVKANCAARTVIADITPIVEVSQRTGVPIECCTFIGSSPLRQYAEGWALDQLLRLTEDAIAFAVGEGMSVMYVTEDTTRADPDTLRRLYSTAIRAGA